MLKQLLHNNRGFAIIIVLMVLAVGSVALVPVLRYASDALQAYKVNRDAVWVQYALDAVTQQALWALQYDTSFQCDPAPTPTINFSDCVASKGSWSFNTTQALPTPTFTTVISKINGQDVLMKVEVPGIAVGPPPPTPTLNPAVAQCISIGHAPNWVQINTPITYTLTIWACTSSGAGNNRTRRIKVLMPPSFTYVAPTTTTWSPVPADMVPDVSICDGVKTAPEVAPGVDGDWYPCPQTIPAITDGTVMLSWPAGEGNYDNSVNINLSPGQAYTWTFQAKASKWGVFYVDALVCYFANPTTDPGPCGPGTAYRTGKSSPVVVGMFNLKGQGRGGGRQASSSLDNGGSQLISDTVP